MALCAITLVGNDVVGVVDVDVDVDIDVDGVVGGSGLWEVLGFGVKECDEEEEKEEKTTGCFLGGDKSNAISVCVGFVV